MLFLSVPGFLDYAGPTGHSRSIATSRDAFLAGNRVQRPNHGFSKLNRPAHRYPYLRFNQRLAMLAAKLGAKMDSLLLSCRTLSFPTTCRFIPGALPGIPFSLPIYYGDVFNVLKLLAASCVILAAHAEELTPCSPVPGAEQLWTRSEVRFVLVGEMHGTAEAPAIFADLVCSAREAKRPIVVGIELREQHALDVFIASGNSAAGLQELLSAEEWKGRDGRTSAAMLMLIEQLRALKLRGVVSGVVAFAAWRPDESSAKGEERMASALLTAAARNPDALVIALTGNLHACKKALPEVASYRLMASFLPPAQTVSLAVTDRGGQAWNCQGGACGPHSLDSSGGVRRGVSLASPHPAYDGVLSTGLPATASLPASR
jgi:hypothetical protein